MYEILISTHSIIRWIIILLAITVVFRSARAWLSNKTWSKTDSVSGLLFTTVLDFQFIIGIILYLFYSPVTKLAFQDFGAAMKNSMLRFFTVEHLLLMLVAIVLAHLGKMKSSKAKENKKKHRVSFIYYLIAFILILLAIPWPFLSYGRPWLF